MTMTPEDLSVLTCTRQKMLIMGMRHGTCYKDPLSKKYHSDAVLLTEEGVEEIRRCAEWITRFVTGKRLLILSSPIQRALETSEIIRRYLDDTWIIRIETDDRLSNKQADHEEYERSLYGVCRDLRRRPFTILLITHGRVLKMLQSITLHGRINRDFMDQLEDKHPGLLYFFDVECEGMFGTNQKS